MDCGGGRNRSGPCFVQTTRASFPDGVRYCCRMRTVRIGSFGSQGGDHTPDGEGQGQGHFRMLRPPARCTSNPPCLYTLGQLRARILNVLSRPTGACYWPTSGLGLRLECILFLFCFLSFLCFLYFPFCVRLPPFLVLPPSLILYHG